MFDVNVLIALLDSDHVGHRLATQWFAENLDHGASRSALSLKAGWPFLYCAPRLDGIVGRTRSRYARNSPRLQPMHYNNHPAGDMPVER